MTKGNVLVIGNSGVGKSTLINAVLGEEVAKASWGTHGTTAKLELYGDEEVPFRVIDTIGFEPAPLKALKAVNAVRRWSRESAQDEAENKRINVIWFCVDGAARKLFPDAIKNLLRATEIWKSVPIVVVITKSYSIPERAENIQMVYDAFSANKRDKRNLRGVIPVVASTYVLNEYAYAAPDGITELIELTNDLMPEGVQAGTRDIASYQLNRRRILAHGLTLAATAAAVVVGATPIPIADALILSPLELGEVNALARIYGIQNNEESKRFLNSIVEVGTVSIAARAAISALKAIPGVNLGASVLNAVIAGGIVAAIGEGSVYAFEQIYLGEKNVSDIDWVKKLMESKFSSRFVEALKYAAERIDDKADKHTIARIIFDALKNMASPPAGAKN